MPDSSQIVSQPVCRSGGVFTEAVERFTHVATGKFHFGAVLVVLLILLSRCSTVVALQGFGHLDVTPGYLMRLSAAFVAAFRSGFVPVLELPWFMQIAFD